MKNLLISFSDIHFKAQGAPEDQGVVLDAFIEDVVAQVQKLEHDDVFLLIGGDLVQSGEIEDYNAFDKAVIRPLLRGLQIEVDHILAVPGNHDLKRDSITPFFDNHHAHVWARHKEKEFNDLIRGDEAEKLLCTKFHPYFQFMAQKLNRIVPESQYSAYTYELDELWSVLCVNSAILSEGGLNEWEDERYLAVDTRSINEWVKLNRTRKKILLMHHPVNHLTEDCEHEILEIGRRDFDVVLTGHTHYQTLHTTNRTVWATNPKLFTTKTETLGYSIICIDDIGVDKVIYRQWAKERRSFAVGINFAGDEEHPGEEQVRMKKEDVVDQVQFHYKNRLTQSLSLYKAQPDIWLKRFVTSERIDIGIKSINDYQLLSEEELIEQNESFYLYSPADGGLTCYGLHFVLTLRESYSKTGVYIMANSRNIDRFQQHVEDALREIQNPSKEEVNWVVLDQWRDDEVAAQKYNYLQVQFPNARFVFMTNQRERVDMSEDGKSVVSMEGILKYYLTPMDRNQLRILASAYSERDNLPSYQLLKRLDDDLRDFNMHRTPMNCITLLESFYRTKFEDTPINRTAVLSKFLGRIFDMVDLTYDTTLPSMKECEYATGSFCAQLIKEVESGKRHKNSALSFRRSEFEEVAQRIFDWQGTELGASVLFDILCGCKIIVQYDAQTYTFRFRTWVYYFAATWMNKDSEFAEFILSDGRYLHYPDIIEFYTGISQGQEDALLVLTKDLNAVTESVKTRFNVRDDFNPFDHLRLDPSEGVRKRLVSLINKQIQSSALEQDVKDHMIDQTYIPSSPYNQKVYQEVMEYTVKQMFSNIEISSKALRNTTLVKAEVKENMLASILSAWSVFAKVVSYMSKDFAHDSCIDIDGMKFSLVKEYSLLDEEYRRISIIANIPYNIMLLFQGHIYSPKMGKMLNDTFEAETDRVRKHLLACLLVAKTPNNWDTHIDRYMRAQKHDSFYLTDILKALSNRKALSEPQENVIVPVNRLLSQGLNMLGTGHADGGAKPLLNKGGNMANVPALLKIKNHKKKNKRKRK